MKLEQFVMIFQKWYVPNPPLSPNDIVCVGLSNKLKYLWVFAYFHSTYASLYPALLDFVVGKALRIQLFKIIHNIQNL